MLKRRSTLPAIFFDLPHYRNQPVRHNETESRLEKTLSHIFKEEGLLAAEEDHYIPELAAKVDLRLNDNGNDILFELDGRSHFVLNLNDPQEIRFNGSTHLQTALLEILYPFSTTIRANDKGIEDFDLYTDRYACLNFSRSLMKEFSNLKAGAFKTVVEDGIVKLYPFFNHEAYETPRQSLPVIPEKTQTSFLRRTLQFFSSLKPV